MIVLHLATAYTCRLRQRLGAKGSVYFFPLCSLRPLWLLRVAGRPGFQAAGSMDDHRRDKPICKSGDSQIKWSSNEPLAFQAIAQLLTCDRIRMGPAIDKALAGERSILMQSEILFRPSFSMTRIQPGPNEEIRVEGGAMVSMSDGITIKTKMQGGLLKSWARSVFGGKSKGVSHLLLISAQSEQRKRTALSQRRRVRSYGFGRPPTQPRALAAWFQAPRGTRCLG